MIEFFIAKKHIVERKKQSLISVVGITIGVVVLMVSIGIANGLDKNMINSILSVTSHIMVSNGEKISNYKDIKRDIEAEYKFPPGDCRTRSGKGKWGNH